MKRIKIGIVGYGNLGKGVEAGLSEVEDMELVGIFTRRDISDKKDDSLFHPFHNIMDFEDKIDVMILCGGSHSDIPNQSPIVAKYFNTVDSYDNHSLISEHFDKIDAICREHNKVSVISTGWDPGLFSINRTISEAIMPSGHTNTFWGPGVSQGHSDAIRKIPGVLDAVQYTIPNEETLEKVNMGELKSFSNQERHKRVCYVVAEDSTLLDKIQKSIINMPQYFEGYETTVHFVSEEELYKNHSGIPHGGSVKRIGSVGNSGNKAKYSFALELDNNPEFTASVNIAFARACFKLGEEKSYGAKTVLDIPPAYLSPKSSVELRRTMI